MKFGRSGFGILFCLGAMVTLSGCGGDSVDTANTDSGAQAPTASSPIVPIIPINTFDAPHAALPLVKFSGGRVMANPSFMAISFPASTFASSIETFLSKFAASASWTAMTSEYGVSSARAATPVRLLEAAPATIDDSQIQSWLSARLNSVSRPLGAADSNTIYVLNYPQSTTVAASGQKSCVDFDGYHSEFSDPVTGTAIVYAVIANCSGYTVNDQTATISHELVEAATDPDYNPAYYTVDQENWVWNTVSYGSEVGDLCQDYADSYFVPSDVGFRIQASWSNAQAAAGNNPCVPASADPYFNAAPALSDTVTYQDNGQSTTSKGISIPVGHSRVIELDLFSSAQTAAWQLSASEFGGSSGHLSFGFSSASGVNGDKVLLTITVHSINTTFQAEPFWIKSTLNGVTHYWPVVVGN
ncbi:MAG: hypothetical protein HY074_19745 [Deltaproteobacteria bacterium]|nr:hypothetical protein [Deltaproteobacteria bacterium]